MEIPIRHRALRLRIAEFRSLDEKILRSVQAGQFDARGSLHSRVRISYYNNNPKFIYVGEPGGGTVKEYGTRQEAMKRSLQRYWFGRQIREGRMTDPTTAANWISQRMRDPNHPPRDLYGR